MHRLIILTSVILVLALTPPLRAQDTTPSTAIENVTVIDVESGARVTGQTVFIEGNRIAEVGSAAGVEVPFGARTIDGRGKFLIPGLWQMHAHAFVHYGIDYSDSMAMFQLYIANGVTGLRDMGSTVEQLVEGRKRIQELGIAAPRIFASGPLLDARAPNPRSLNTTIQVPTPQVGRLVVDLLKEAGMDLVKMHGDFSPEVYAAIAERSQAQQIPLAGHVPQAVTIVEASDAGQISIEHLGPLVAYCVEENGRGVSQINIPKCEAGLETLRANDTFFGPTLIGALPLTADSPLMAEARLRFVKPAKRSTFGTPPEAIAPAAQARYELSQRLTRMASEAGVRLIASSDSAGGSRIPGFTGIDELILFVEAGVSPFEALRAGTLYPAILVGREDDLGTVEAGKLADLVLLDADPLTDVRNLRRVAAVVADGRVFEGAGRQALLDAVLEDAGEPN